MNTLIEEWNPHSLLKNRWGEVYTRQGLASSQPTIFPV